MKSIIFSAPMIRQLLAGKKTMTRRPVKTTDKGPRFDVGDTVYVKEGWGKARDPEWGIFYRADHENVKNCFPAVDWKSPLFMPKELSRMLLHITGVRQETLGFISGEDAIKEGFANCDQFWKTWDDIYPSASVIDQVWVYEFTVELVKHP